MSGIVERARRAFAAGSPGWARRRDLAALAGMFAGSAVDFARLGPLGIVEICGDPGATLSARIGAHGFGYAGMLIAIVLAETAARRDRAWRAALHAAAMCAGMAVADVAVSALQLRPTLALSLLAMTLGMACGSLAARVLAGSDDACDRGRRWV